MPHRELFRLSERSALAGLALATLFLDHEAGAQGAPPFPLVGPGTASQSVLIVPSAEVDDASHQVEVTPTSYAGESRAQSGQTIKHGRLWTIPGTVAYGLAPNAGSPITSAPLPDNFGSRPFVVFEDPIVVPGPTSPFRFLGQHFFDAQCSTATCGFLDGGLGGGTPLKSEAESSFDLIGGSAAAVARSSTPDHGRRYYDAAPGGGDIYNHVVDSTATAGIQDWIWVTGPGSTATLVVTATIGAALDTPPAPVTVADWTTPLYGDIRGFDPCSDVTLTSNERLRPTGLRQTRVEVGLGIAAQHQFTGGQWIPSIVGNAQLVATRSADLHWADEEGLPDCSDDFAEVTTSSVGSLAPTLSVQRSVPTNQWTRVTVSTNVHALCEGPFDCDLDASAPVDVAITSPNGTLGALYGIAGLTPVPEAEGALFPLLGAAAALARRRQRC